MSKCIHNWENLLKSEESMTIRVYIKWCSVCGCIEKSTYSYMSDRYSMVLKEPERSKR